LAPSVSWNPGIPNRSQSIDTGDRSCQIANIMAKLASLLPISVLTDSYKATHYLQYPSARTMVAVSS
jgi:hypothetical protein